MSYRASRARADNGIAWKISISGWGLRDALRCQFDRRSTAEAKLCPDQKEGRSASDRFSCERKQSGHCSCLRLDLRRCAGVVYRAWHDDKILALTSVSGLHELADRSDRIDDRRSRWIGHEGRERL